MRGNFHITPYTIRLIYSYIFSKIYSWSVRPKPLESGSTEILQVYHRDKEIFKWKQRIIWDLIPYYR